MLVKRRRRDAGILSTPVFGAVVAGVIGGLNFDFSDFLDRLSDELYK